MYSHAYSFVWACFLIAIICFFSACTPAFVTPDAPTASTPEISGNMFISYDGAELPLRKWLPSRKPDAIIVGVHGLNDYANFITEAAQFFNNHQIAVYAYDQRGFGETWTRGRWSGRQAMAADLHALVSVVRITHPGVPVYIIGDSMGGAVTIITMVNNAPVGADGVILVAPAVWARSEMPVYQRFALWLSAHVVPWMKVSGRSLDLMASDNIEMLKALGKDPLVIKETRIEVLYGLSNLMDEAFNSAEQITVPALVLYGAKDEIIPKEPVDSFYQRLPLRAEGEQQMLLYGDGYHMLLRDLQGKTVLQDIVDWIDQRNGE